MRRFRTDRRSATLRRRIDRPDWFSAFVGRPNAIEHSVRTAGRRLRRASPRPARGRGRSVDCRNPARHSGNEGCPFWGAALLCPGRSELATAGAGVAGHKWANAAPRAASSIRAFELRQNPPPTLVGERVNTQGSRKVKRLLLANEYDGILAIARDQVEGGAHLLDVCVALTERPDEAQQMIEV